MELDETIFNAVNEKKNFELYGDQPIVPAMVKPVNLYDDELIKMAEDRRESNFSLQSDISIGTTESENSLPHIKYFRTPSVVVSDHSEDTGCVTYEDIRRMHNAYHRRRRCRPGRRHSDVLIESNEKYEFERRSDPTMIGSASTETIEHLKNSQNVSPLPRRKNCGYRDGQNSLSLDNVIGGFELDGNFDRKTVSECGSSNELSPILSQYGSSNCSENSSRRSSIFSEISPVFLTKNLNFNDPQKVPNFDSGTKTPVEKNSTFSSYYNSREAHPTDDSDLFLLERQRSLSYDDLYLDSSLTSDRSYSDLSTDISASSSLSNLPGTVYYYNYNPCRDYDCSYRSPEIVVQTVRKTKNSKGVDIKTSKSCSDFLSVSRIVEDYPHLRRRRHSNDQIAFDTSEYRRKPSDCEGAGRKKWANQNKTSARRHTYRMSARIKVALGRLLTLQLKSFHESLNFQKENFLIPNRKTKSNENVYECERKKASIEVAEGSSKRGKNNFSKVNRSELQENEVMKVADDNKKVTVKKEWLSVNWKDSEYEGDLEYSRKISNSRKISDCSTCSNYSDISGSLNTANAKTKTSGWRKLRNIVQWTPFFQTYKKQRYPWVQLAGHQGNFKAGPEQGTILKKLCPKEEKCYKILMKDVLRPYVPEYKGQVTCDDTDSVYLQLQDLLVDFVSPCVLDCKLGVRTYLEEELQKAKDKPKLRKDMYEKMIQIDPKAPTLEEHRLKAVTKPRYMVWRETISSTSTLGFRLEGIRTSDGKSSKDFKTTRTKDEVKKAFRDFINGFPHAVSKYVQRLKAIKATLEVSIFFSSHEVIGSSLLFVHDKDKANVWLIDFAKTLMLPDHTFIDHKSQWEIGNHEDGYLIGINNLIQIFTELEEEQNLENSKMATGATTTAAPVNSANQT